MSVLTTSVLLLIVDIRRKRLLLLLLMCRFYVDVVRSNVLLTQNNDVVWVRDWKVNEILSKTAEQKQKYFPPNVRLIVCLKHSYGSDL
jgi:hypothetical protein